MKSVHRKIKNFGFTLIELLIVIAILGILAVALLAAINPIEQINRGQDTGTLSDAEQLLNATNRFYASQGYFPWQTSVNDPLMSTGWTRVANGAAIPTGWVVDNIPASGNVLGILSAIQPGGGEITTSFVNKVTGANYNRLFVYNRGTTGDSTFICFIPRSSSFQQKAAARWANLAQCTGAACVCAAAGIPADLTPMAATICTAGNPQLDFYCLP